MKDQQRSQFTDLMRSMGIYLMVCVHIFVSLRRTAQISDIQEEKILLMFRLTLQCGMPMFFYYSGKSSIFSKDSYLIWLKKKFLRLIVPTIFVTLLFVVPTAYIGRIYRPQVNNKEDIPFTQFYMRYFIDEFSSNGFEWLWFLPVLFGISIYNYPFIIIYKYLTQNSKSTTLLKQPYFWFLTIQNHICLVIVWIFIPKWFTLIFISLITYYLYIFQVQHRIIKNYFFQPSSFNCFLLAATTNYFLNEDDSKQIMMIAYYNIFYINGLVDELDWKDFKQQSLQPQDVYKNQIQTILIVITGLFCIPYTDINVGGYWAYSLYNNEIFRVSYVFGSFIWIQYILRHVHIYFEKEIEDYKQQKFKLTGEIFDESLIYKYFTSNTIVIYLLHWFFIEIANRYIVYQLKLELIEGFIVLFCAVVLGCYISLKLIEKSSIISSFFGIQENLTKNQNKQITQSKRKEELIINEDNQSNKSIIIIHQQNN